MTKSIISKFLILIVAGEFFILGCNPKTLTTTTTAEKTDECLMMDEVCAEAMDFQKQYNQMPEKEKKDMAAVLSTYVTHCEKARKQCENSKKKE